MSTGPYFNKASERRAWMEEQEENERAELMAELSKMDLAKRHEMKLEEQRRRERKSYAETQRKRIRMMAEVIKKNEDRKADMILARNKRAGEHFKTCPALAFQVVSFTRSNRNLVAGA